MNARLHETLARFGENARHFGSAHVFRVLLVVAFNLGALALLTKWMLQ